MTRKTNLMMEPRNNRNASDYNGVYYSGQHDAWRGNVQVNGRMVSLGLFDEARDAGLAVVGAKQLLYSSAVEIALVRRDEQGE